MWHLLGMCHVPDILWWNPIPSRLSGRGLPITCKWVDVETVTGRFAESSIDTWPLLQIRNPLWVGSLGGNNRFPSECEWKQGNAGVGRHFPVFCGLWDPVSYIWRLHLGSCIADLSSLRGFVLWVGMVVREQIRTMCTSNSSKNNTLRFLKPSAALHIESDFCLCQPQKVTDHPHLQMKNWSSESLIVLRGTKSVTIAVLLL